MTFGEFVKKWSDVLSLEARVVTLPIKDILDNMPGDMDPDVREMLAEGMANMAEFGYKLREDPNLTQPDDVSRRTRITSNQFAPRTDVVLVSRFTSVGISRRMDQDARLVRGTEWLESSFLIRRICVPFSQKPGRSERAEAISHRTRLIYILD